MKRPPAARNAIRDAHLSARYPGDLADDLELGAAPPRPTRWWSAAAVAAILTLAAAVWWSASSPPTAPVDAPPIAEETLRVAPVAVESPTAKPNPKGVRLVPLAEPPLAIKFKKPSRPMIELSRWRPSRPQAARRLPSPNPQGDSHDHRKKQRPVLALAAGAQRPDLCDRDRPVEPRVG